MKNECVIRPHPHKLGDEKSAQRPLFRPEEILHCNIDAIEQRQKEGRSNPLLDSALPQLLRLKADSCPDQEQLQGMFESLGIEHPDSWLPANLPPLA